MSQNIYLTLFFLILICSSFAKSSFEQKNNVQKTLFSDEPLLDLIGLILVFFTCIVTIVAGTGGGPFFIPIALLIFKLNLSYAVPFSSSVVFGVQIIRFFLSYWERHPKANRPPVDYRLAALFSPSTTLGTIFGVILNQVLPEWITMSCIIVLITISSYLTVKKAIQIMRKEKLLLKANKMGENIKVIEDTKSDIKHDPSINNGLKAGIEIKETLLPMEQNDELKLEYEKVVQKEARPFHWDKLFYILILIVIATLFSMLKGSKKAPSLIGVQNCSAGYWVLSMAFIPISIISIYFLSKVSIQEYLYMKRMNYNFLESDLHLNKMTVIKISIYGFFVGVLGSMLGIGGGIIVGPLFLEMKLDPTVASYTASFLAFFTAGSSTLQYIVWGQMTYDYSGMAILFGTIGGIIGLFTILRFVQKYNKQSIIVIFLAITLILSCACLMSTGIFKIIEDQSDGKDIWEFKSLC